LALDKTLGGTAKDCSLTTIELVQIGESEPYASCRMIFSIEYYYNI
jgi:hypothetical protein